jgi:hypothetical protein
MSDAHGGGGGGGYGFIIAVLVALAVLWFYNGVQKQKRATELASTTPAAVLPAPNTSPDVPDTAPHIDEESPTPAVKQTNIPATAQPTNNTEATQNSGHGTTYYLNKYGEIVDVVQF